VADVDSLGGYVKQYVVQPDSAKLASFGVSYAELADALEKANLSVGADFIQRSGEAYLVRGDARLHNATRSRAPWSPAAMACRWRCVISPRSGSAANCAVVPPVMRT